MTKEINIDLVAASSTESTNCFTVGKDGIRIPDYRSVIITVLNPDGSQKVYRIHRQNQLYQIGCNHHIESYTRKADPQWYDPIQNKNWKQYDNEGFKKRLEKLSKELRKLNYEVRIVM